MRQHQIQIARATLIALGYLRLIWVGMLLLASVAIVIGVVLATWWYPINYLIEGEQYHEKRLAEFLSVMGFDEVRYVSVDVPDRPFRDFDTKAQAYISMDGGETFQCLGLHYGYERISWLSGRSRAFPTQTALEDKANPAVKQFAVWWGRTREELLEFYEPDSEPAVDNTIANYD